MSGRGTIVEDIENIKASMLKSMLSYGFISANILAGAKVNETGQLLSDTQSAAAHYLTPLNNANMIPEFWLQERSIESIWRIPDGRIG